MLSQKNILIVCISLIVCLISCQPGPLVKPTQTGVDSVLFFEEKEISDPFLQSLFNEDNSDIELKTQLNPPAPPPPPNYREVEGFRVQVFAGLDSINALTTKHKLQAKLDDPVYLLKENGLVKIQVGDYLYRVDADNKNLVLRREGFPGAWVVQKKIRITKTADSAAVVEPAPPINKPSDIEPGNYKFKIQIIVTGDLPRAEQLKAQLQSQFNNVCWFEEINGLYKVFLGKFQKRESADALLNDVRQNGFSDAWLVY